MRSSGFFVGACIVVVAAISSLMAAPKATTAPAVKVDKEQVERDIADLVDRKIIDSPDYWTEHLVTGAKCDGVRVQTLFAHAAAIMKPGTEPKDAVAVLTAQGVFNGPQYWTEHAVAGAECDSGNVSVALNRLIARLPGGDAPTAMTAVPLAPIAPDQIKDSYDVVIAGAGTGGCGAAIQAARMGRSVLLIEESDWIGGQALAAAVTSMDEGVTLCRERGLYHELCGQITAYYKPLGVNPETAYGFRHMCVEPRVGLKLLYLMLGDARGKGTLDLVLRSRITKVAKDGNLVTGADIESVTDAGRQSHSVKSKVLVDATEWGDVIPLTGARYRVGNCTSDAIDPSRHVQDNTWTAVIKQYPKGVPPALLVTKAPPGYSEKVQEGFVKTLVAGADVGFAERPWSWTRFIGYRAMPDSSRPGDSPPVTRTHMNFNNDYPATVAEIENPSVRKATDRAMRLKTLQLLYYIQTTLGKTDWSVADDEGYDSPYNRAQIDAWIKDQPELEPYRAILYQFSVIPYTRESRRIIGLHTLTASEIDRNPGHPTVFPNTVALGDYAVDLHGSMTMPYLEAEFDHPEDIPHKFGERGLGPFAIPFECFIPEKVDGFLPAEKNISQSRMASGATRLQPHTLLMGQAVGTIASLAIRDHIQPREVDPVLVQMTLLGAKDTLFITPLVDVRQGNADWRYVQLVLTHGLFAIDKHKFDSKGVVDAATMGQVFAKLFGDASKGDAGTSGQSSAEFVKALVAGAARSAYPFVFKPTAPGTGQPMTRIEAARIAGEFLEERAAAKESQTPAAK